MLQSYHEYDYRLWLNLLTDIVASQIGIGIGEYIGKCRNERIDIGEVVMKERGEGHENGHGRGSSERRERKNDESGTCGENVRWSLSSGILTISGSGEMTNYSWSSNAPWYSSRTLITEVLIENGVQTIGTYAFEDCSSLTSITIPSSVTTIGSYAFRECSFISSITIPDSVTTIGNYAFSNCSSLTSITIPDSVLSIGNSTFSSCSSLTSIAIPDSISSIGDSAFYHCSSLKSIEVSNQSTSFASEDGVLFAADRKTLVYYPAGKTETRYHIPDVYYCGKPDEWNTIRYRLFFPTFNLNLITPQMQPFIIHRASLSPGSLYSCYSLFSCSFTSACSFSSTTEGKRKTEGKRYNMQQHLEH